MTAWYTSLADPMEMYGVLRTGEFSNYGGWSDATFDAETGKAIADPLDDPARTDGHGRRPDRSRWSSCRGCRSTRRRPAVWLGDKITGVAPSIYYMYYPWAATIGAKG